MCTGEEKVVLIGGRPVVSWDIKMVTLSVEMDLYISHYNHHQFQEEKGTKDKFLFFLLCHDRVPFVWDSRALFKHYLIHSCNILSRSRTNIASLILQGMGFWQGGVLAKRDKIMPGPVSWGYLNAGKIILSLKLH